jgi:hypothetical protein
LRHPSCASHMNARAFSGACRMAGIRVARSPEFKKGCEMANLAGIPCLVNL